MLCHTKWPIVAAICCLALPAIAVAQLAQRQPGRANPNQPVRQPQAPQQGQRENHDAFLAEWLILDNENEIEVAKLAMQKATSEDVKQFAQKMIADHEKLNDALRPFTGGQAQREEGAQRTSAATNNQTPQQAQGNTVPRAGQSEPVRRTVARVTEQGEIPGQAPALGAGQGRPQGGMLGLKRELADQCLASALQELDRKSGKEFDECYIGMQIGAHMYVVDAMTVFQRHASPELKQTIAAGEQAAQGHLQMAKNIMKQQSQGAER